MSAPDAPCLAASGRAAQAGDPARRDDRAEEVPRGRPRALLAAGLRGARRRPRDRATSCTPLEAMTAHELGDRIGLVPILRAGLGMVDAMLELMPTAQVWHLGLFRDERTLRPVEYYNKLPDPATVDLCLILDPMLATGGSATAAIEVLKHWGAVRIKLINLIAAPEGVRRSRRPSGRDHPQRGAGPPAQRARLHRARPRRRGRPPVRDRPQLGTPRAVCLRPIAGRHGPRMRRAPGPTTRLERHGRPESCATRPPDERGTRRVTRQRGRAGAVSARRTSNQGLTRTRPV